jgi:hypothetical protein
MHERNAHNFPLDLAAVELSYDLLNPQASLSLRVGS